MWPATRIRVASRLITLHDNAVAFKWKDYRITGRERYKTMILAAGDFISRFLMHVLLSGFHSPLRQSLSP